jgi:hypothetical protein
MKERRLFFLDYIIFTFCFLLLLLGLSAIFANVVELAKADVSGNGITKDAIVFQCSYGDVTFTHKKHNVDYKIDCYNGDCHHHTLRKNKQDLCRDCHKAKAEGNTPSKKEAFHESCKKCHENCKKENKPAGPTACKDCHKKK